MNVLLVVAAIVVVAGVAVFRSYNRFVAQRQLIRNSWANVDTELQRRHELVPNLVETVRGYGTHEQATFEEVVAARQRASARDRTPAQRAEPENTLASGMRRLLALSESYPALLASSHFLQLQSELVATENRIQAARRIYNGNIREYNRRVDSIPSNVIASIFRFRAESYFELEPLVRDVGVPSARL